MSITDALNIIKAALPLKAGNKSLQILKEMAEAVKEKTKGFKEAGNILSKKVDLQPVLKQANIAPAEWKKVKGSLERSEADAVKWLADMLRQMMQAEAEALAELELLNLKK